jgi:hypothetical protein
MKKKLLWTVALVCSGIMGPTSRGWAQPSSLEERFLTEAPRKWDEYSKLAAALQHTLKKWTVGPDGKVEGEPDYIFRIKRTNSGSLVLYSLERDGSKRCYATNGKYAFELMRQEDTDPWVAKSVFADLPNEDAVSFLTNNLLNDAKGGSIRHAGPYELYEMPVTQLIKRTGFRVRSAKEVARGGKSLVRIEFLVDAEEETESRVSYSDGWLLLDPDQYWMVIEYEGSQIKAGGRRKSLIRGTHECGVTKSGIPALKRSKIEIHAVHKNMPTVDFGVVIQCEVEEREPTEDEFTLSAFGLPEPPGMPAVYHGSPSWYLWIGAIAFCSLAIGVGFRAYGRRRYGDTRPPIK